MRASLVGMNRENFARRRERNKKGQKKCKGHGFEFTVFKKEKCLFAKRYSLVGG
jgi:hypothetical protein